MDTVTADIDLTVGSRRLKTRLSIPVLPMRHAELLPIVRAVADASVAAGVEDAIAHHVPISCKAGCGACCRQLVPIPQVEARRLRDLVEAMPEPRREQVRARFAAAIERLDAAGLLAEFREPATWTESDREPQLRGMDYFHLGIACPFLEDESCSIYPERPLVCREYLVVTPAERCADPKPGEVVAVRLPFDTWRALARATADDPAGPLRWVPLILALEWAENNPEPEPVEPGPELVRRLFAELTHKEIPAPPRTQEE